MKYQYQQGAWSLGGVIAAVISWKTWHAFWWAVLHMMIGWWYVIYWLFTYGPCKAWLP